MLCFLLIDSVRKKFQYNSQSQHRLKLIFHFYDSFIQLAKQQQYLFLDKKSRPIVIPLFVRGGLLFKKLGGSHEARGALGTPVYLYQEIFKKNFSDEK